MKIHLHETQHHTTSLYIQEKAELFPNKGNKGDVYPWHYWKILSRSLVKV